MRDKYDVGFNLMHNTYLGDKVIQAIDNFYHDLLKNPATAKIISRASFQRLMVLKDNLRMAHELNCCTWDNVVEVIER